MSDAVHDAERTRRAGAEASHLAREGLALERPVPPPGLLSGAWRVAWLAGFSTLRGRRVAALLLLSGLPVVVAVLLRIYGRGTGLGISGFVDFLSLFYFTVVTPVTCLFLGAAAIGDELEDGTLLYVRMKPLPRTSIVLGRAAAATGSALLLLVPAIVVLYVVQVGARDAALLRQEITTLAAGVGACALGAAVYTSFFLLLSLWFRHAVIIGLFLVVGWEGAVSLIPSRAAALTVAFHESAILSHVTLEGQELRDRFRRFASIEELPTVGESVAALGVAAIVGLVVASLVFRGREYLERSGEG